MKLLASASAIVGVALGVLLVVLGEADDSPGLQLIGVVIAIGTAGLTVSVARRSRRRRTRLS